MCLDVACQISSKVEISAAVVEGTLVASLVLSVNVVAAGRVSRYRAWDEIVRT